MTPIRPEGTALVPTNQQRRDAERRRLQKQLEERRAQEAARKRFTLIASIVGTLVVIGAVIGIVVATTGGSDKKKTPAGAGGSSSATTPSSSAPASTPAPVAAPAAACVAPPKGTSATFEGLTVTGATDLKHEPKASGKLTDSPATVTCQDLVVGKGAVAKTSSQVTVQYVGLVGATGKVFQSSWGMSSVPAFGLAPGSVIDGFSQGIAGAGKIAPMHVGGRRIIVMPAAAAYGASPPQGSGIPANADLVFIVDLQKVS